MLNVRKGGVAKQHPRKKDEPNSMVQPTEMRTDAELLRRLQNGDEHAWSQLTTEWSPRLYRYLRGNLPTVEDVEDVLSETMIATVQAIQRFDGKVTISTFIYAIANRKVADFWRKRKDADILPDTVMTAGPDSSSLEFQEALAMLPDQSRQVLLLRYHMGLGVEEISKIIGRSYKATESLLSRARSQLKTALDNAGTA